jgi:hypothetical protein
MRQRLTRDKAKSVIAILILLFFSLGTFSLVRAEVDSAPMKYRPIHAQFASQGCFQKEILDTILAGIPVTYTFQIKVYQPIPLWFDREISSLRLIRKIQYDNLKNEYRVTLNGRQSITKVLVDFSEVKKMIENVNETVLVSSDLFKKNDLYYLKYHLDIKAESASDLPLPLEYLLSLLPWGQSKTGWSTIPIK